MRGLAKKTHYAARLRNEAAAHLYAVFSTEGSPVAGLDRWTQRRVTDENMAKIALVLESDDPVEHCYQNLVREIDTEAEMGIYLVRDDASTDELRYLAQDPGISGELHEEIETIAPIVFADELAHSNDDQDIVWVTIEARYERAKIDAAISEIVMSHVCGNADNALDMCMALRSMLYSFHENVVRCRSGLPKVISDQETRELVTMVSDLADRGGNYERRVTEIGRRAGTL